MTNTFFWNICGTINCSWQWVYFVLSLLVTVFTIVSLIQTFRYHQKLVFELLPLSMNVFSMFLLTILHVLAKSFQLHLAAYLIQIYIYFLFCYSFTSLYLQNKYSQNQSINKAMSIGFGIITLAIIILVVCVFAGELSATCFNEFMPSFYAFFSLEIVFYLVTLVFAFLIRKEVKKRLNNKTKIKRSFSTELNEEDRFIKERIRQIWLILLAYTITIVLRITCIALYQTQFYKSIECIYIENVAHILKSNSSLGQFILILNQITQIIPHLLLPVVLYVIPSSTFKKGQQIDLEKDLLQNPLTENKQEDEESNPYMKSQLSSFYEEHN